VALQFTPWALTMFFATAVAGAAARYVWTQRRDPGGLVLFALALCAAGWSFLKGASLITGSLAFKSALAQLMYVPISLAPLCWLAFAMGYAGRGAVLRKSDTSAVSSCVLLSPQPQRLGQER